MFIFLTYAYFSLRNTKVDPDSYLLLRVALNVLISELLFWVASYTFTFAESFGFWNLVGFFILQDLWFYVTHIMFHHVPYLYQFHKIHHSAYSPVFAWLAHPVDHLVVNLGSFAVAFMTFGNPYWVFVFLSVLESWSSVSGHDEGTPHHIHHKGSSQRYGSIYLFDRLFGSY